jgi:hypothetical protein
VIRGVFLFVTATFMVLLYTSRLRQTQEDTLALFRELQVAFWVLYYFLRSWRRDRWSHGEIKAL